MFFVFQVGDKSMTRGEADMIEATLRGQVSSAGTGELVFLWLLKNKMNGFRFASATGFLMINMKLNKAPDLVICLFWMGLNFNEFEF